MDKLLDLVGLSLVGIAIALLLTLLVTMPWAELVVS